jgi:rare lipoprotein A
MTAALLVIFLGAAQGPNNSEAGSGQNKAVQADPSVRNQTGKNHAYEIGTASWYGEDFDGKQTASGEDFDMYALTAAHPKLPLGSYVKVTNLHNGRAVVVKVNDRGPIVPGRIIDLSYAAARVLLFQDRGVQRVRLDLVRPHTQTQPVYQTVAYNRPMAEFR